MSQTQWIPSWKILATTSGIPQPPIRHTYGITTSPSSSVHKVFINHDHEVRGHWDSNPSDPSAFYGQRVKTWETRRMHKSRKTTSKQTSSWVIVGLQNSSYDLMQLCNGRAQSVYKSALFKDARSALRNPQEAGERRKTQQFASFPNLPKRSQKSICAGWVTAFPRRGFTFVTTSILETEAQKHSFTVCSLETEKGAENGIWKVLNFTFSLILQENFQCSTEKSYIAAFLLNFKRPLNRIFPSAIQYEGYIPA